VTPCNGTVVRYGGVALASTRTLSDLAAGIPPAWRDTASVRELLIVAVIAADISEIPILSPTTKDWGAWAIL